MKICVIGVGKWGLNHVKTLISQNVDVSCIDIDKKKLDNIKSLSKNIPCFRSAEETIDKNYDGYIVSTPPSTHADIAKYLIKNNKPVLVEKPLALSLSESNEIREYLKKYRGKLVVGHLLLFHPAIQKMKSMINNGRIGKIQYIYSNRLNLGTVRNEENVFWSFAPHDISLFQFFSDSYPIEIISRGGDFLQKKVHDTTITHFKYPNEIKCHIYVSWLHPFKEHRLVIIGSKGSLHFEDTNNNKSLIFYKKENQVYGDSIVLKDNGFEKIVFDDTLPLENEIKHFINVINGAENSLCNIEKGIEVIKILETATRSLNENQIISNE